MLEALVNGYHDITLSLGVHDQLSIGKATPLGFRHSQDLVVGEGLLEARINALV